jgi:hypothetical protein
MFSGRRGYKRVRFFHPLFLALRLLLSLSISNISSISSLMEFTEDLRGLATISFSFSRIDYPFEKPVLFFNSFSGPGGA